MDADRARRLSRRLWTRHRSRPARFAFAPSAGLLIEPVTEAGRAAYGEGRAAMKEALDDGEELVGGALLVDADNHYVLCGPGLGRPLLEALAAWTRAELPRTPALLALAHAGVADVPLVLKSDEAIALLDADRLPVARAPELWAGLLPADEATVAGVLARARPGERLWFWADPGAAPGELPLLVEPVATDPDRHRMEHLLAQLYGGVADDGVTGVALPLEDGRLQLVGRGLRERLLRTLAGFALREVAAHPGLARLRDAELVVIGLDGRVERTIARPDLWSSLPVAPVPTTVAGSAAALAALPAGASAWFRVAADCLAARPLADDPDAVAFRDDVASLAERYPSTVAGAVVGVVRRLAGGELLFTAPPGAAERFGAAAAALLDLHPDVSALARGSVAEVADGGIGRVVPCVPA